MKKSILALSIAASLALAGCGNDAKVENKVSYEDHIVKSLQADTKIEFDVLTAPILPTFLAVDTHDGTLSTEGSTGDENYKTDLTDPVVALGKADGWSTTQPIKLSFGKALNTDLALAINSISVIETSDPMADTTKPAQVLRQLKPMLLPTDSDADYAVSLTDDNKSIIIMPVKPLNPKSHYMFAITNQLQDNNGEAVGMSESYAVLKTTVKPPSSDLIQAQGMTHLIEGTMAANGIIADPTSIIYSSWFTTGSVGDTLYATKAAVATGLKNGGISSVWKGSANPNNVDLSKAYSITESSSGDYSELLAADENFTKFMGDTDGSQKAALQFAYTQLKDDADNRVFITVSKGTVKLPHYLEQGSNNWSSTPFESGMPSLAIVSNALKDKVLAPIVTEQLIGAGIDMTKLSTDPEEQLKLIGLTLTDQNGNPLDSERLVTQYSPVPQVKSLQEVPYLLFTPTSAATEGSIPVVIYQHGITSVKETSYAFANNLAANGIAVIAIDNPLHGDRSLDATRSANADIQAYLNLTYLPVARDNIRQSMLDINGLRTALSVGRTADTSKLSLLDSENVSFLGHSLGGVVGAPAVVAANRTLGTNSDSLFSFQKAAFANSGGDIANLLFGSDAFGSLIKHSLMYSSSADYKSYADASCTDRDTLGWENLCFDTFESAATDDVKAELDSTFSAFIFAAQTIIGTADPVNAAWLAKNNTIGDNTSAPVDIPMYMLQVKGDNTVPNNVATAPLAGTEAMAALFGLESFVSASESTGNDFAKFKADAAGLHSTFIAPSSLPTTPEYTTHVEMQSQIVQFFASPTGKLSVVTDGKLEH